MLGEKCYTNVLLVVSAVLTLYAPDAYAQVPIDEQIPQAGIWRAWFDSPGGQLPFGLEFKMKRGTRHAWIINEPERIPIPIVSVDRGHVTLDIDYYDSKITAALSNDGKRMDGKWRRKSTGDEWSVLEFHAIFGRARRFSATEDAAATQRSVSIDGHWRVTFSKTSDDAIGIFQTRPDLTATGTFMTTTGDYRFLAGTFDGRHLNLSGFDGAHAFLFKAELTQEGTLAGDFWSRDTWHETWTARRAEGFALPDPFQQTLPSGEGSLDDMAFPDIDGRMQSLSSKPFAGKARIVMIFGSWCPNCHDATAYMIELDRRYRDRGLTIVGLAFELTGQFERDAKQVRTYIKRNGVTYPVLIAGVSDKQKATKKLPIIDKLRSFPTTLFFDAKGRLKAVHTGFTGPATGVTYLNQRAKFESIIETLLTK